jgi:hypothetical protein
MNHAERLAKAFALELPDRPPILGGWLAAPEHIQSLTGCSDDEYWDDPFHWGMEAEHVLESDGVVTIFTPIARGGYRCVDGRVLEMRAAWTVESVLEFIDEQPEPAEIRDSFDEEADWALAKPGFVANQERAGDIVWTPAGWDLTPHALWYSKFGYETALMALALHPDRYRKLIQISAEWGRRRSTLHARAIREGIYPTGILLGEDLCSQRGPLVSPEYLRREYWPLVKYTFEPLLAAGAKLVWHCDGDYRPLLDEVMACGVAGLQGFQRECGMELEWIVDLKTRDGDPLLIFGPMSVTTTLPHGTPDDVRAEVHRAMDLCRDKASLVFFTSNTMTPDVPMENILA